MQLIGNRVSVLLKDEVYSVVILPTDKKWKVGVLFLWLLAWSVCGVIVITNYFTLTNEKTKVVLIIYMAFWAYFEYKIGRAFLFRRFGKEKLWIKNNTLFYKREVNKRGKTKECSLDLVSDLKVVDPNRGNFFTQMQESFWVIAGERLSFRFNGKDFLFGIQLNDDDAYKLHKVIKKYLSKV